MPKISPNLKVLFREKPNGKRHEKTKRPVFRPFTEVFFPEVLHAAEKLMTFEMAQELFQGEKSSSGFCAWAQLVLWIRWLCRFFFPDGFDRFLMVDFAGNKSKNCTKLQNPMLEPLMAFTLSSGDEDLGDTDLKFLFASRSSQTETSFLGLKFVEKPVFVGHLGPSNPCKTRKTPQRTHQTTRPTTFSLSISSSQKSCNSGSQFLNSVKETERNFGLVR